MGIVVGYMGMDGDGDDLETSRRDRVGDGIRVLGTVGDGYKYLSPCSSLYQTPARPPAANFWLLSVERWQLTA